MLHPLIVALLLAQAPVASSRQNADLRAAAKLADPARARALVPDGAAVNAPDWRGYRRSAETAFSYTARISKTVIPLLDERVRRRLPMS